MRRWLGRSAFASGLARVVITLAAFCLPGASDAQQPGIAVARRGASGGLVTRGRGAAGVPSGAKGHAIELKFVGLRTPEQIDTAFSAVRRAHAQALYVIENALFFTHRTTILKLVSKARLPTIYWGRQLADAGGLTSYRAEPR